MKNDDAKKVLVIGGSGFLGSHVVDALCNDDYEVRIFDKEDSPYISKDQEIIIDDVLNVEKLDQAIKGCDIVYNFAAIADLDVAMKMPVETAKVNILGNAQVLDACVKNNVQRYMFASTVYVHSREGGFYRCSKIAAENYIEEYKRNFDLDYTVLRYGSLYGPRSDHHNGVWRVIKRALDTSEVSYEGSIEAMREYIHVVDAAIASVAALNDEFCNQHVVLTGQEPMRVLDFLKMIAEILGLDQNVKFNESEHTGHYIRTPYAYQPKLGRKYVHPMHVDLGQGLLELIAEIKEKQEN